MRSFSDCLLVTHLCACAQIVIAVMHLGRLRLASNTLSVLVAFQVLLLWVKAQYYARYGPHGRLHALPPRGGGGCAIANGGFCAHCAVERVLQ